MKRLAPSLCTLFLVSAVATGTAHCQTLGERGVPVMDDFMREVVTPPSQALPLSDYLIALATATDTNIIADATDFSADAQGKPYPASPAAVDAVNRQAKHWEPNRSNLLFDIAATNKLSRLRYDNKTFLFWSEPDPLALAPPLIAARNAELARLTVPPLTSNEIGNLLRNYYVQVHHWDGKITDNSIKVNIDDLPVDIRNWVLLKTRDSIAGNSGIFDERVFDEEYWKETRLIVRYFDASPARKETNPNPILEPHLVLAVPSFKGGKIVPVAESGKVTSIGNLNPLVPVKNKQTDAAIRRRD